MVSGWWEESVEIAQKHAEIPFVYKQKDKTLQHYDPGNTKRRQKQRTSGPKGDEFNQKFPKCLALVDYIGEMTHTVRSEMPSDRLKRSKFVINSTDKQRVQKSSGNTHRHNSYGFGSTYTVSAKQANYFKMIKETSSSTSSSSKNQSNQEDTSASISWPQNGSILGEVLLTDIKTTKESPENFLYLQGVLADLKIESLENDEMSKLLESIGMDSMDIKTTSGLSNFLYEYEKRRRRGPNYARRPESANKKYGHTAHIDSLNNSNMNLLVIASFQGKCRALEVSSCHNCFKEKDFHLEEILAENGIFLVWFRQDFNDRRQHAVSGDGNGPRASSSHRMSYKDGNVPTFKEWTKTIQNCKDDFEWIKIF